MAKKRDPLDELATQFRIRNRLLSAQELSVLSPEERDAMSRDAAPAQGDKWMCPSCREGKHAECVVRIRCECSCLASPPVVPAEGLRAEHLIELRCQKCGEVMEHIQTEGDDMEGALYRCPECRFQVEVAALSAEKEEQALDSYESWLRSVIYFAKEAGDMKVAQAHFHALHVFRYLFDKENEHDNVCEGIRASGLGEVIAIGALSAEPPQVTTFDAEAWAKDFLKKVETYPSMLNVRTVAAWFRSAVQDYALSAEPPQTERLKALVAKWKKETETGTAWDDGYVSAMHACADELAAELGETR